MLLGGCGSKIPFSKKKLSQISAQVYIYAPQHLVDGEDTFNFRYKVYIDEKLVTNTILESDYMVFNLKPLPTSIFVIRDNIIQKKVSLNLQAGFVYYLKIIDDSENGDFSFMQVRDILALSELKDTNLAGSFTISTSHMLNEEQEEKHDLNNTSATISDEIEKAYELKKKGVLSEEEFIKLKQKLLK
ncbi:hypothetical protein MNB_SM-4-324 [hydrothermal vent metagenome]|uniref:SHOCT domain-containing protein n=1 Tax=hydrothermal vent metagenome TaxID=652676 RepID=A0A1W1BKS3_9ZZZZ